MIQILLTVTDDGNLQVHKVAHEVEKVQVDLLGFSQVTMPPGTDLDLHCRVENFASLQALHRLIRIDYSDDTVPQFNSVEEADAWLEARQHADVGRVVG